MPYRVIQWATGSVGAWSLRQIIDNPDLELAGVWVSGAAKDGKDAGELCGRPTTAACWIRAIPEVCAAPPGFLQERVFGAWQLTSQATPVIA